MFSSFTKVGSLLTAVASTLVASLISFEMISYPYLTVRLSVWNYLLKPSKILVVRANHKDTLVYMLSINMGGVLCMSVCDVCSCSLLCGKVLLYSRVSGAVGGAAGEIEG